MKLRSDSPFAKLSPEEQMMILETSEVCSLEQLIKHVEGLFPKISFSVPALKRFLRRMKEEEMREEAEDSQEAMEGLVKSADNGRARDGVLEAMRRKLYMQALDSKDPASAMSLYMMMRQERMEDRKEAREARRLALEEENARLERRHRELEEARTSLALLPKLTAIVMEGEAPAEDRLRAARECLGAEGARLLLARG